MESREELERREKSVFAFVRCTWQHKTSPLRKEGGGVVGVGWGWGCGVGVRGEGVQERDLCLSFAPLQKDKTGVKSKG